ncbi:MobB protein [Candidatus Burkholderia pumila]|uniref:MobB protein n=1 Tax=Candidatus Burkholderia pumila TaxID=1090375 RepID=A0ABR5HN32_9BURK|nr:MobB protein [Candidatus Burkholderia pumila]
MGRKALGEPVAQWLNVVQRETTKTNVHGGEQWEGHRMVGNLEQPIVSQSTLLNLPARIAIAYMPGRNAAKLYTCYTKVDRSVASWVTPAAPAMSATPAAATESTQSPE